MDAASSQVAYLYTPDKADELVGLSICFLPTNPTESAADAFSICAWENNNGKPGRQLRCDEVVRPDFGDGLNQFMNFEFSEPLQVDKSIFVGWQQSSKLRLNVGWDVNRVSQSKIFYNTSGEWLPTSFTGSLMLRPIFGSITTDIAETESTINLSVYPNPVSDWLTISGLDDDNCQLAICNAVGQTILCAQGTRVNVSSLQSGIYIARINHNGGTSALKFIKK